MSTKHPIIAGLLLLLALVPGPDADPATVIGPLEWTQYSVCEWPINHYLHYYVTDCCGNEIWFYGDMIPDDGQWQDGSIYATGGIINNGSCTILEVREADVCLPPEPDEILDHHQQ